MKTRGQAVTHRAKCDKQGEEDMKTQTEPKTEKTTWKQLTIRLPENVHRALKVRVAEEGRNMGDLIEGLVRQYLVGGKKA